MSRFVATATNQAGLRSQLGAEVFPVKCKLALYTVPANQPLYFRDISVTSGYSVEELVNTRWSLRAARQSFCAFGTAYVFQGW